MAHEFEAALILGLVLITIGVLIFNSQASFTPYSYGVYNRGYATDTFYGYQLISSDSGRPIFVGTSLVSSSKTEDLGTFFISTTSSRILTNKRLFSGALFGYNSLNINGNIRDLQLRVLNSNGYGNLILTADNGAIKRIIVDKELSIGSYNIPIQNDGTVEIKAASSGWRIWAPTIYDVQVDANVYNYKSDVKEFIVEPNVTNVDVKLYFTSSTGKIRVKLNDKIILERDVRPEETISLNSNELQTRNSLVIDAWDGSEFRGRVNVIKYSRSQDTGKARLDFFVDEGFYKMMAGKPGRITFDITRVEKPGQMILKIRNSEGNVIFTRVLDVNQDSYSEYFTEIHVKPGVNTFTIEALDSAFWVRDIKVWMMDP